MLDKPHTLDEIIAGLANYIVESIQLQPTPVEYKKLSQRQAKASILDWVVAELEKVEIYDSPDMTQEALRKQIAKLTALKEGLKK